MKIQEFTKAGKIVNEDAVFANDNFACVIDGATGLAPEKITPYGSDAEWFASKMRDYLVEHLKGRDIPTALADALTFVNNEFKKFDGADDLRFMPSAAISIYQIIGDKIEFFVLGDCSVLFRYNDDTIEHYHCEDLEKLDKQNLKLLKERAEQNNIDVVKARPLIQLDLERVRNLKNKVGGYWILCDSQEAVKHGIHGIIDKTNIKDILLTSDGYAQIYDLFKAYTASELFEELQHKTLAEIYDELYALQEDDKDCNKFTRFKLRDDASAIYVKL